jgi:hypothetical protein
MAQGADLLDADADAERHRQVVMICYEAHLLSPAKKEKSSGC